ncbi:MAG: peptidylprolyl isomerase [Clostridia bacterium]|nr:peptidylprolyl isomerase [Clostridia bacterium]
MENENIRENENLTEEEITPEVSENEITPVSADEVDGAVSEADTVIDEIPESTDSAEDSEDVIGDEWQNQAVEAVEENAQTTELTEEELAALSEIKRRRRKKGIIISAIVVVVIAIMAYFVCAIEGVGSNTIVSKPITASQTAGDAGAVKNALSTDNIKYENPLAAAFDKITGKNKDVAITINGEKVNRDVLNFVVNSSGINSVYTLMQMQMIKSLDDFDWNAIDETSDLSYLEVSKGMAVETLIPIYAVIAEGEKHGITLDEDDEKKIADWIAEQKANYGDEFESILKKSGYETEETLAEIQRIQLHMQKVYEDISKDVTKYATPKQMKAHLSDDKVTVKHILVKFEEDETGAVTDDAKAKAKEKAEEVLSKVKAGEDFDKLIEQYNDDPGATDEGYTFANDGTMVQEFADASFALEIGATSELVETTYGYHIIKRIERKITADEYIEMLQKTVDVRIKKGVYDNMKVTIDLNDYFGAPTDDTAEAQTDAE